MHVHQENGRQNGWVLGMRAFKRLNDNYRLNV